jgi:hypothetical protein
MQCSDLPRCRRWSPSLYKRIFLPLGLGKGEPLGRPNFDDTVNTDGGQKIESNRLTSIPVLV